MENDGIQIDNVSFQYGSGKQELKKISTTIPAGSFCGITGLNGSGKTTLTYLLNGLIPHEIEGKFSGRVYIDGIDTRIKPVSFFARKVGMVFQNPDFMIFNLTVYEEITFGLKNLGFNNIDHRVNTALKFVDMLEFKDRDPHTLSMGQKQKLCLAVGLAMDTDYIVLDEPSAMLDFRSAIHLYKLLSSFNQKGKTIIIVEHDTDFLATFADRILILDKGSLINDGKPKEIFSQKTKLQKMGIKIPKILSYE